MLSLRSTGVRQVDVSTQLAKSAIALKVPWVSAENTPHHSNLAARLQDKIDFGCGVLLDHPAMANLYPNRDHAGLLPRTSANGRLPHRDSDRRHSIVAASFDGGSLFRPQNRVSAPGEVGWHCTDWNLHCRCSRRWLHRIGFGVFADSKAAASQASVVSRRYHKLALFIRPKQGTLSVIGISRQRCCCGGILFTFRPPIER